MFKNQRYFGDTSRCAGKKFPKPSLPRTQKSPAAAELIPLDSRVLRNDENGPVVFQGRILVDMHNNPGGK